MLSNNTLQLAGDYAGQRYTLEVETPRSCRSLRRCLVSALKRFGARDAVHLVGDTDVKVGINVWTSRRQIIHMPKQTRVERRGVSCPVAQVTGQACLEIGSPKFPAKRSAERSRHQQEMWQQSILEYSVRMMQHVFCTGGMRIITLPAFVDIGQFINCLDHRRLESRNTSLTSLKVFFL